MMNKRYLLFAGDNYYPSGGANDLIGIFSYLEEAKLIQLMDSDWAHIYDIETKKIVAHYHKKLSLQYSKKVLSGWYDGED